MLLRRKLVKVDAVCLEVSAMASTSSCTILVVLMGSILFWNTSSIYDKSCFWLARPLSWLKN